MAHHQLKTDPDPFQAVLEGRKKAEIRTNDRGFQEGDTLELLEVKWIPGAGRAPVTGGTLVPTGRRLGPLRVTHVLTGYGIPDGLAMLSIEDAALRTQQSTPQREALALANEVAGMIDMARECIGNSNASALERRVAAVRATAGAAPSHPSEQSTPALPVDWRVTTKVEQIVRYTTTALNHVERWDAARNRAEYESIRAVADALLALLRTPVTPASSERVRRGIYVASKTRHAYIWKGFRDEGYPIISTWLDESEPYATLDWPGLWARCTQEASTAGALVLYAEEDDDMRGAFVELGAALSHGVPCFFAGDPSALGNLARDTRIAQFASVTVALRAAERTLAGAPDTPVEEVQRAD